MNGPIWWGSKWGVSTGSGAPEAKSTRGGGGTDLAGAQVGVARDGGATGHGVRQHPVQVDVLQVGDAVRQVVERLLRDLKSTKNYN